MNEQDVRQLIQNGESSKVEFKTEDVHPVSLAEEIVAFANFEGGTILVGVEDDGRVTGCKRKGTEAFIINVCRNNVRPALIPVIERILVGGQIIYAVTIGKEEQKMGSDSINFFIRDSSMWMT
jgi:ATP-dependent DNA helicase RecG